MAPAHQFPMQLLLLLLLRGTRMCRRDCGRHFLKLIPQNFSQFPSTGGQIVNNKQNQQNPHPPGKWLQRKFYQLMEPASLGGPSKGICLVFSRWYCVLMIRSERRHKRTVLNIPIVSLRDENSSVSCIYKDKCWTSAAPAVKT